MQPWEPERDDTLQCVAVREETHDVRSFVFAAVPPRRFAFDAGQFMTFTFRIDGRDVPRCYTIASPPTRPERLAITVKRQPGGIVSPWLHQAMRPGMHIQVAGPMGDFRPPGGTALLLISGGSGITPLMSYVRAAYDRGEAADIVFVHAARSPEDIIFAAELHMMARHWPGFRVTCVCETGIWPGYAGRLSLPMLQLIAPDCDRRTVFCCGPAPFMAAVRGMLAEAGADPARYHQESFDFATLAAEAPAVGTDVLQAETATFAVRFATSGVTAPCAVGMTVLEAARAAGLRLPASCTQGLCGTCKSRLVSGRVDMRHQGGIREREVRAGLFLPCCSRPLEDLVVER